MDRITNSKYAFEKRQAVEPQQAAFYANRQFRYFDRLVNIASGSQIVYKATIVKPIEVFTRELQLWSGGREYLVYIDSPNIVFTGTLVDSGRVANLNNKLSPKLTVLPQTAIEIQRAVGSAIFSDGGDLPIAGTGVLTDGNSNRASSVYTPDTNRLGIPTTTMWLVLNNIAGSTNTSGHLSISYEE